MVGTGFLSFQAIEDPPHLVQEPINVVVEDNVYKLGYITARNGNASHPDSLITINLGANMVATMKDAGLKPSGVSLSQDGENIYISTKKSHSITTVKHSDL